MCSSDLGESWILPKTRGSFICHPKVLIADRGISRHVSDGTFSNGHCGTAAGLNAVWIQRLIMKERSANSAQSQSNPCSQFEKKGSRTVASCFPRRHTSFTARLGVLLHPRLAATVA